MANIKSLGKIWDANLTVETGTTLTAGTFIWADISGTNVVHAVRAYSGATPESAAIPTGRGVASLDGQLHNGQTGVFLGVIENTQTGVPNLAGGSQTGVTFYTKGVFQFRATPTASCALRIGQPVYPVDNGTVRGGFSGQHVIGAVNNITGSIPIGVVSYVPSLTANAGHITTGSTIDVVRIKLITPGTIQRSV